MYHNLFLIFSELFMEPKEWHKIRGVIMIASMKAISVAVDNSENENFTTSYEYFGYMLCSVNLLFGPWTPYENYLNLYKKKTWVKKALELLHTLSSLHFIE